MHEVKVKQKRTRNRASLLPEQERQWVEKAMASLEASDRFILKIWERALDIGRDAQPRILRYLRLLIAAPSIDNAIAFRDGLSRQDVTRLYMKLQDRNSFYLKVLCARRAFNMALTEIALSTPSKP